jgi:hypothetical protein
MKFQDKENKTLIIENPDIRIKRTKERTITDIIEKVSTWRKLYNGVLVPTKDETAAEL